MNEGAFLYEERLVQCKAPTWAINHLNVAVVGLGVGVKRSSHATCCLALSKTSIHSVLGNIEESQKILKITGSKQ